MKNTWVITFEATMVRSSGLIGFDEEASAQSLKSFIDADDVVITKVQKFEGTDGGKE